MPIHRELKSFRLAQPVAAEFTSCTLLSLSACGIWLFLLPLELLRFAAS